MEEFKKRLIEVGEVVMWLLIEIGLAYLMTKEIDWIPDEAVIVLGMLNVYVGKMLVVRAKKSFKLDKLDLKQ